MTQKERVMEYITEFGSITPLEAFKDLGCMRLADVIWKLEKDGYEFDHVMQTGINRFGEKTHFMRYSFKYKD